MDEMLALLKMKTGDPEVETEGYGLFLARTGDCLKKHLPMDVQGVREGSRLLLV